MVVCFIAGQLFGALIQRAIEQHIEQYKEAHPIPQDFVAGEVDVVPETDEPAEATTGEQETADAQPVSQG